MNTTTNSTPMRPSAAPAPIAVMLRRLVDDVIGNVLHHLELLGVEARHAISALGQIAILAGVAIFLIAAAFFLLIAAAVVGLIALGLPEYAALGIAAVVCLVAGLALAWLIRPRLKALEFPATFRQLRLAIDAHTP